MFCYIILEKDNIIYVLVNFNLLLLFFIIYLWCFLLLILYYVYYYIKLIYVDKKEVICYYF